ncbi:DUF3422 family protein [Chitinilyticum litopenaei]|uniref:DUF3422 family protein n=1 Tax=Chitinilyticum litopenaei TaxID=1121276 RepID=UPI00041FF223|nr:DUF3422 domain-containing protein [Chitinilyticum litopenaei]
MDSTITRPTPAFALTLHDHPQRRTIASDALAHPYTMVPTPGRVSHIAWLNRNVSAVQEQWLIAELALHHRLAAPRTPVSHVLLELPFGQLLWTRHAEFSSITVSAALPAAQLDARGDFAEPALALLPPEWLAQLPGNVLVAAHALVLPYATVPVSVPRLAERFFAGNELLGADIGDGAGVAYSDAVIHADGFSRYVLADRMMGRRQAGRMLQRLFDIDGYRQLAMLAPPLAKNIAPELDAAERELAELTGAMPKARQEDEAPLLDRLTQLAARIESALSRTDTRFTAARSYQDIVERRLAELRESRIQGLQPFGQFVARRLTPALEYCGVIAQRQRELAERVSRATALLRTRVDIGLEQQNQQLLGSMERRTALQLRLQETVEGLSVAAISYYLLGLLGYALKGLKAGGLHLNVELTSALLIPLVAGGVAWGLHRTRRHLLREHG